VLNGSSVPRPTCPRRKRRKIIIINDARDYSGAVTNKTLHRELYIVNMYATGTLNTVPEMISDWQR